MTALTFRLATVLFLTLWISSGLAQTTFQAPPDVTLTTRFSLDVAALWAESPSRAETLEKDRLALEQAVREARSPVDQAAAKLALANWHLAVPTAEPATRWLLNMAGEKDLKILAESATAAQEQIVEARKLLGVTPATTSAPASAPASEPAKPSSPEEQARRKLVTAAERLDPFLAALASAVVLGDEATRKSKRSAAARGLSSLREVENEELAASALMWQAFMWNLAGREGRSTVSLPNATEPPKDPDFDFVSRLVRCQILADNGHYLAAMAMAMRVRSSCEDWFPKESPQSVRSRERLAALVQCAVGTQWMHVLRKDNFPANADRLEAQLIQVQNTVFGEKREPMPIYTLKRAVPILVQLPKAGAEATENVGSAASRPGADR